MIILTMTLKSATPVYTNYKGEGGINQVFLGFGKSWKYLSIGMNTGYNLGRKKIDVVKAILFNSDSTYFYQSLSSTNTSFGGTFLNLRRTRRISINKFKTIQLQKTKLNTV